MRASRRNLDVMGTTIATYLHTCLSGYVAIQWTVSIKPWTCGLCLFTWWRWVHQSQSVCAHMTHMPWQPCARGQSIYILPCALNMCQHLDHDSFMQIVVPIPSKLRLEARFKIRPNDVRFRGLMSRLYRLKKTCTSYIFFFVHHMIGQFLT